MAQQCSKHVEEYNKLIKKQEFVHYEGGPKKTGLASGSSS